MTRKEFTFNIYKTDFFGQYWQPKNPKAVVILVHGMGEHSTRYTTSLVPKLAENDFSVVTFDHFGHGNTKGKRGHNPSYEAVLESIEKTIEKAQELQPNLPLFLYGHSMGGNAVINYTLRKNHTLKAVIVTSPMLKLAFTPPAWKLTAGKIMQKIAPSITLPSELDASHISRIKEEVDLYINDPLVHDKVSPNFSILFFAAADWAIENASKLSVPMYLLHGTDDKIIDYKGTESFANNSKNAILKLYEGGYHELHNDLCKEEMLKDVVNWLDSQL